MSPDDAVRLLAVARAAYPGMSLVEGMPQVWHGALGDLQFSECADAVVEHSKGSASIVTVADIRRIVVTARRSAAGEERQHELAARSSFGSDRRGPMPDWFRGMFEKSLAETRASGKYGKLGPMAKDIDRLAGGAA